MVLTGLAPPLLRNIMAPEVRLIALDIAVVGCEIDAHVDHIVRRKRGED